MVMNKYICLLAIFLFSFVQKDISMKNVFEFPKPTGSYAVGCKTYHWMDENRQERRLSNLDDNRELMVKVWYPAKGFVSAESPYALDQQTLLADELAGEVEMATGQKVDCANELNSIRVYAVDGADCVSGEQFPLVFFSHGSGNSFTDNTVHCENLASHGYVVVAVNHTYDSRVTVFPDGRKIENKTLDYANEKARDDEVDTWVKDIQFVLDQITCEREKSCVLKCVDLNKVGVFGHSLGGAVAIEVSRRDARIKVAVGMDAALFNRGATALFKKPLLLFVGGQSFTEEIPDAVLEEINLTREEFNWLIDRVVVDNHVLYDNMDADSYKVVLPHAGHTAFNDFAFFKTLPSIEKTGAVMRVGSVDSQLAIEIVNAYQVVFFDKYLKAKTSPLLDGEHSFGSEVAFEKK